MSMVRVYDFETQQLYSIPARELAPGMIEVQVQGIDGTVWVQAAQLRQGEHKHPPFPEDVRQQLRRIQVALEEVHPQTIEEWEDGFRRDANPEQEIAIWLRIAAIYHKAITGRGYSPEEKQNVFRVLLTCTDCARDQVLLVTKLNALSREEAEAVIEMYYEGK